MSDGRSMVAQHWEGVYGTKPDAELSWFEPVAEQSLALIKGLSPCPRRIIDVGGGQSALAAGLLALPEWQDAACAVLDISPTAIDRARARAGATATRIRWVVGDVLGGEFADAFADAHFGAFDLWHDRAVFHFLVDPDDRACYARRAAETVAPHGFAIIGAFAPDGPERCSGLAVQRHDAASIVAAMGPAFSLVGTAQQTHVTPWGKPQSFAWAVLQRRADPCSR